MSSLRVISVNIELDRHLDRIIPFLKKEEWDVILINEFLATDVPKFEDALGEDCFFVPKMKYPHPQGSVPLGHGIFSKFPTTYADTQYAGPLGDLVEFDVTTSETQLATQKYFLITATVTKEGKEFKIGLTHFPWTPDGEADAIQRVCAKALLELVEKETEIVLFGDFNAPRGKEIFSLFTEKLKDNIPVQYETSLDKNLHRSGKLTYMVDGLFTTPEYQASDVKLHFGVSDHAAVTATITKK